MSPLETKRSVDDKGTPEHLSEAEVQSANFVDVSESPNAPVFSPAEEKRLLRKLDLNLLPFLSFLYLLSFLDRSNVGNAKIAGMATELGLTGLQYSHIASIFFYGYVIAEVPSNIALKRLRPSVWIPIIMLAWGVVMTLMGLVQSFEGLMVARIFLGLCEAGLFPGVTYYITMWYRRSEHARRTSIFFTAATMAGAFGGLLAAAISEMDGIGGQSGWRWIFYLEGLLTVVTAIAAYFIINDFPETARFLNESERSFVVGRLKRDASDLANEFSWTYVKDAFVDPFIWLQALLYLLVLTPLYTYSLFLPTIISNLGYSNTMAQLLSAPPYIFGCLVTLAAGFASDYFKMRGPINMCVCVIGIIGFSILYSTTTPGVQYFAVFLAAAGSYPCIPVCVSWNGGNIGGSTKRGVGMAIQISIGNLGGAIGPYFYKSSESPRYPTGHGTLLAFLCGGFAVSALQIYLARRANARKEALCAAEGHHEDRRADYRRMGDNSPLFRYTI